MPNAYSSSITSQQLIQPGEAVSWLKDSGRPTRVILRTPLGVAAVEESIAGIMDIAGETSIERNAIAARILRTRFNYYRKRPNANENKSIMLLLELLDEVHLHIRVSISF